MQYKISHKLYRQFVWNYNYKYVCFTPINITSNFRIVFLSVLVLVNKLLNPHASNLNQSRVRRTWVFDACVVTHNEWIVFDILHYTIFDAIQCYLHCKYTPADRKNLPASNRSFRLLIIITCVVCVLAYIHKYIRA